MFRKLIALLAVCVVVLTGLVSPAYAGSNHVGGLSVGAKQKSDSHESYSDSHDSYIVNTLPSDSDSSSDWETFVSGIKRGVIETAGFAIGGVVLCFAIDGAASTVFPPAAALLPYCPSIGAVAGGGNAIQNGVQAVNQGM